MELTKLVDFARENYPEPTRKTDAATKSEAKSPAYCVGGALMFAARDLNIVDTSAVNISGYPSEKDLVNFLRTVNPTLDGETATEYAGGILWFNCGGAADNSWDAAENAVSH